MLYPTGIKAAMAASGKAAPPTGLPPGLASLPAGTLHSGAVAGRAGAGRFDLVPRSYKPLPDVARRDISEIFTGGLAITGQAGKIAFQTVGNFPISPMERTPGQATQGFLV